eukprot:1927846-Amphidinium_carterae.2
MLHPVWASVDGIVCPCQCKVHHEGWTKDSSSKDRCVVPQSDIYKFMKCDFDIEACGIARP